jgi:IS5 family transposase
LGVKRVCVPNRAARSAERKREQKERWFRDGQRWRTGAGPDQRDQASPRPQPLPLSRRRRHAPLGIIADNLINLGNAIAKPSAK